MAVVCVIGAGAAGLCAARHLRVARSVARVDVLEQTSQLGGTWVYTDQVGYDDFGLPVHTSMYKNLRTNIPKEIMAFPDFPLPVNDKSYLPRADIMTYLHSYAENFGIHEHIQYKKCVQQVTPKNGTFGEIWDVSIKDLVSGDSETREYDYIFVCNGHHNTPFIPKIPGLQNFEGDVMHSHDYRVPQKFTGKRVLVIGAGSSGRDLSLEICDVAKKVIFSHHQTVNTVYPDNLVQKGDVVEFVRNTAIFKDGKEEIDVVFLCTGYLYNFPFLSPRCGVTVDDNCVEPLYKQLVNIHHPSMCFVGLQYYVCAFTLFDLQVRYYINFINGTFKLPSRELMLQHSEEEKRVRAEKGFPKKQTHMLGTYQEDYFQSLASEAHLKPLPSFLTKVLLECHRRFFNSPHYREDGYRVIDDDTYEITSNGEKQTFY